MKKLFIQSTISVVVLLSFYITLRSMDWMTIFKVKQSIQKTEEKIGALVWDYYLIDKTEITSDTVVKKVDSVFRQLCITNKIDQHSIQLHVVESDEINAFSLPGNQIVVNKALIDSCNDNDQLASVLAHELAHLELNHITKKLIKEFGLAILITSSGSGEISGVIKEISKLLSSTAYDRQNEKEADLQAVQYLQNASIDPYSLIAFLKKIETKEISWVSTHPNTDERISYISKAINKPLNK
jgi:predicted Zn-dependent protease